MAGSARHSPRRAPTTMVRISPLGSPWSTSKQLSRALCTCSEHCGQLGTGRVVYRVGTGRVGIPGGYYPAPPSHGYIGIARAQPLASPRLCVHQGTPGTLQAPPHTLAPRTQICPSGPNKARFRSKYTKVSHKSGVSPKYVNEACHSPCFKNWSIIHDLEFPRF